MKHGQARRSSARGPLGKDDRPPEAPSVAVQRGAFTLATARYESATPEQRQRILDLLSPNSWPPSPSAWRAAVDHILGKAS